MKGAIFRDKYEVPASGKDALNIGPLGELIDLYQKHLATEQHDKIYALLGMCSDSPNLDIDYRLPWATLMKRVIGHVASKAKIIPTRNSSTGTAISSKGCILGHILSVKVEGSWGDEWRAEIMLKFPEATHDNGQTADWVFQSLAEDIEEGDIICLLLGNGTPTIIRQRHDHFVIIAIAVNSRSVQIKDNWTNQLDGWAIYKELQPFDVICYFFGNGTTISNRGVIYSPKVGSDIQTMLIKWAGCWMSLMCSRTPEDITTHMTSLPIIGPLGRVL